jgi:hypothetical protein
VTENQDSEPGHVSTFALDVHFASGRPGGTLESHIADCDRCRAYVARLEELRAGAPREPVTTKAAVVPFTDAKRRSWVLPLGGALTLAAAVFVYLRTRELPAGYVATKGTPAVELLVQRDQKLERWDERFPIHPHDRLALRVACEDFSRVTVATPEGHRWSRLYDKPCSVGEGPLPFSLVVDEEPGDEYLAVVLSREPLDDALLARAIDKAAREHDAWVVKLDLVKTDTAP